MRCDNVFDNLNSEDRDSRVESAVILHERHYNTLLLKAYAKLLKMGYCGDVKEASVDIVRDLFIDVLKWADTNHWPRQRVDGVLYERTEAPWKEDLDFVKYCSISLENRVKDAVEASRTTESVDPTEDYRYLGHQAPMTEEDEPVVHKELDAIINEIRSAMNTRLRERHRRVIAVFAKEYSESGSNLSMTEMYFHVGRLTSLAGSSVKNVWSDGISLVKEITNLTSNNLAADLLTRAALVA